MRSGAGLSLLLMLISAPALAAGGAACVKAQCEVKGRTCVEALYATHEACMKAGNAKCASTAPAEGFNCLKGELTPCALARNKAQETCLAEVRACHATCGPHEGERTRYWCVGSFGRTTTAAVCEVDKGTTSLAAPCGKVLNPSGPRQVSMTCEPL